MKRRDFLAAAGLGAGAVLPGSAGPAMAADRPKEAALAGLQVPEVRHDRRDHRARQVFARWSIAASR